MKYRNTKTGAELDAACEISGGDWEPVPDPDPEPVPDPDPEPVPDPDPEPVPDPDPEPVPDPDPEPASVSEMDHPKPKTKATKAKE